MKRLARFIVQRANPLAIIAGLACITAAAFMIDITFGIASLGLSLILAGVDVRSLR